MSVEAHDFEESPLAGVDTCVASAEDGSLCGKFPNAHRHKFKPAATLMCVTPDGRGDICGQIQSAEVHAALLFYCPEHKYSPAPNSGICICPRCEIGAAEKAESSREDVQTDFGQSAAEIEAEFGRTK